MTAHSVRFASSRSFLPLFLWVLLAGPAASGAPTYRLAERVSEANLESRFGRYAGFVESPSLVGRVDLSGVAKESIHPPFPARVTYELELPPSAYLSVDLALVVVQRVTRPRVDYAVEITAGDGAQVTVFAETLELRHANMWHPRKIDLTGWSGRRVRLTLVTRPRGASDSVPWADRVQTVWGDATIASHRWRHAVSVVGRWSAGFETWGRDTATELGFERGTRTSVARFVMSLVLGGLLTLFVQGLYRRFGNSPSNPETFASMFLVLTLTTMFVIHIVQSSLALSLGLLGALTIVRFRTAIKSPNELVYAFLCVSIGISLAANRLLLSAVSLVVVSVFIYFTSRFQRRDQSRQWLLTMSGAPKRFFTDKGPSALDVLTTLDGAAKIQRLDHDEDLVELRAVVTVREPEVSAKLSKLRGRLPGLDISYVDVNELL